MSEFKTIVTGLKNKKVIRSKKERECKLSFKFSRWSLKGCASMNLQLSSFLSPLKEVTSSLSLAFNYNFFFLTLLAASTPLSTFANPHFLLIQQQQKLLMRAHHYLPINITAIVVRLLKLASSNAAE